MKMRILQHRIQDTISHLPSRVRDTCGLLDTVQRAAELSLPLYGNGLNLQQHLYRTVNEHPFLDHAWVQTLALSIVLDNVFIIRRPWLLAQQSLPLPSTPSYCATTAAWYVHHTRAAQGHSPPWQSSTANFVLFLFKNITIKWCLLRVTLMMHPHAESHDTPSLQVALCEHVESCAGTWALLLYIGRAHV